MTLLQFTRARHRGLHRALDRGGLEAQVAAVALGSVAGIPLRTMAEEFELSLTAVTVIVGCLCVAAAQDEGRANV